MEPDLDWRNGDAAFETLVRRWQQPLARFLFHLVGRDDLLPDLCQEVFLRVYEHRSHYRETGAFAPWLYRIALNVGRDALRRRSKQPRRLGDEELAGNQPSPDAICERTECDRLVAQTVAELPEPLRLVLVLRHYDEMSFEDIARRGRWHVLCISPHTTITSRRSAMNPCPRCNVPLSLEQHGDIVMERCDRCGGHWLEPNDLKAILDLIRLPVSGSLPRTGIDLTEVSEDAACPACGVPMEPFNYAGDSGVILDKCRNCGGLWLDHGDLERVLAVVSASEQDLERDVKRFSADMHEQEVRQDALERQDGTPFADPLGSVIASRIADSDPRP